MPTTHQSRLPAQRLAEALRRLALEAQPLRRFIAPAALPVRHLMVPEAVTQFLENARRHAERTQGVSVGTY